MSEQMVYVDNKMHGGVLFFAVGRWWNFAMYVLSALALLFAGLEYGITMDTVVGLLCCCVLAFRECTVFFAMKNRRIGRKAFSDGTSFADFMLLTQIISILPTIFLTLCCGQEINWPSLLFSNITSMTIWYCYFAHTRRSADYFS